MASVRATESSPKSRRASASLCCRGIEREREDVERVMGIEPTLRFRQHDLRKALKNQHTGTRLTTMDVSSIVSTEMASVHSRPDSPYLHAAFRGPDGRLILRSTKQTDRKGALATALEWERAAKLARRGELVEAQAREVLKDIMARADIGETIQTATIEGHFRQWLDTKQARKAERTAERYAGVVENFLEWLGKRAAKPITALTAADVDRFLDGRLKRGVAPQTAAYEVKIVRTVLNAARRKGLIPTNPAEAVELPKSGRVERGTFTQAEVKMLVDAAQGEWKTLILLGYFTGQRLSDCCRVAWADLDLAAVKVDFKQAKTGLRLTVPIHPDLLAHLEGLAGTDNAATFVMPGMANLKSGGRHGLSEGFKRIVRKAGLDLQTVQGAGVRKICKRTFHALRHSFTSALANAGVAPELRMKLTGHKSAAVHQGYTHHELASLRSAVGKLPGLNAKD
jgi:integrase